MANDSNSGRMMLVAVDTFVARYQGADIVVTNDVTRVRETHELAVRYPHKFKPIFAHYEVEQATANPGERRGA